MFRRIFLPIFLLMGLVFSSSAMWQDYTSVFYNDERNAIVASLEKDGIKTTVIRDSNGCFDVYNFKRLRDGYVKIMPSSLEVVVYLKEKISEFEATLQKDK